MPSFIAASLSGCLRQEETSPSDKRLESFDQAKLTLRRNYIFSGIKWSLQHRSSHCYWRPQARMEPSNDHCESDPHRRAA
jgi:hypothetical protein